MSAAFGPFAKGLLRAKWRVRVMAWAAFTQCYAGPNSPAYEVLVRWNDDPTPQDDSPHRIGSLAAHNALPSLQRRRIEAAYMTLTGRVRAQYLARKRAS